MVREQATAAHAGHHADSAADTGAGPTEPPPASTTPAADTAAVDTEVAGDSSAGANIEVGAADKGKELSEGTVGKALAADFAEKASAPRVQELRTEAAGRPSGSDDVGKGPRKSGNRSFEELSALPHLTLVHEVMRLEAAVRRGKEMAKTQVRLLAQQREKLSELMGWVSENQEAFERGMVTMSRIEARLEESDKRGRADVADAVQEIRVERANATSQRETAERTLARVEGTVVDPKTLVTSAINDIAERTRTEVWRKLVGLEDSVARAAERGAGAGAMILRAVMANIGGNAGSWGDPMHSADRDPKLGAGAAGDASLPLTLVGGVEPVRHDKRSVPPVAEGEASNRAKKAKSAAGLSPAGPKDAAPAVVAVVSGRPGIAAEGTTEGVEESVGDEDAEAREARRKYHAAWAAAKGAGRGDEGGDSKSAEIKQTPMVGVRFFPGQKNPFAVELHHGGERFYLGTFSRAGPARYLSAVAQTVWHDRVQRSELVLTEPEEVEWSLDLDLARKMTAGLYAVIFIRKLAANHKRMLNIFKRTRGFLDSNGKPTVESAICAAIGLEAADDETAVKGKDQKSLYAAALAFGCAAMWSFTSAYTRWNTTGGAQTAFEGVTAEHRSAALQSASAAATLCGASADDLFCLKACWADVYATIRKRPANPMLSAATVEKSVLSGYAATDKTVHVCVPLLVEVVANWNYDGSACPSSKGVGLYLDCEKARQAAKKRGTRGKGKKGDAGEVGRKGEEREHDDEDDDENEPIMLGGSESNEELA